MKSVVDDRQEHPKSYTWPSISNNYCILWYNNFQKKTPNIWCSLSSTFGSMTTAAFHRLAYMCDCLWLFFLQRSHFCQEQQAPFICHSMVSFCQSFELNILLAYPFRSINLLSLFFLFKIVLGISKFLLSFLRPCSILWESIWLSK